MGLSCGVHGRVEYQELRESRELLAQQNKYCHVFSVNRNGVGLVVVFIEPLQKVATNNHDNFTGLHTPNITVTTAHINCSLSSLAVV
jgi:hypothetical protein